MDSIGSDIVDNITCILATGYVELVVDELKVLGKSKNMTPFEVAGSRAIKDELRLKYRYLDLRRPVMQKNLMLRHKITKATRNFLDSLDFIEIETPMFGKSTPEGARDYLVPSRVHPGKFYALPQAPQQFKQMLMISGFDNYFQIAPCFSDEDARADRSPGEFYQMDMDIMGVNSLSTNYDAEIIAVIQRTLNSVSEFIGENAVRVGSRLSLIHI